MYYHDLSDENQSSSLTSRMSSQEATGKVLELQHKLYSQGLITTMPQLQVQF